MSANFHIIQADSRRAENWQGFKAQACITSPPYYGLRDYGKKGQIGLESSIADYLASLMTVFDHVHSRLKDDGLCWVVIGDSYAGPAGGGQGKNGQRASRNFTGKSKAKHDLANKQRLMIPARFALAMQERGWWLRDEIIWAKPNPMPVSVRDRTTPAHEMVYMFSKSPSYYYDQQAIKEPIAESSKKRYAQSTLASQQGGKKQEAYAAGITGQPTRSRKPADIVKALKDQTHRAKRSVWTVATKAFKGAHFATYPIELIEPCVLASTKPGQLVIDPFSGAGSTGLAACKNGRDYIGFELNEEYAEMSRRRMARAKFSGGKKARRLMG